MCRLRRFWKAYKTNWGQVTLLRSNGVLAPLRMPSVGFDWEPTALNESLEESFPLLTEGLPEVLFIQRRLDHSR